MNDHVHVTAHFHVPTIPGTEVTPERVEQVRKRFERILAKAFEGDPAYYADVEAEPWDMEG